MLDLHRDIQSLSHFKRQTRACLKQVKKSGAPMVLTVNGRAEVVVQDAAAYQRLLEQAEQMASLEAVHEGLKQMRRKKGRPLDEVFASLRKKFKLLDPKSLT